MENFSLEKYSTENLERIKKVIAIVSDSLELQGINRIAGNKIPLKKFEDASLSYPDVINILKAINEKFELYKIVDLEIEKMIRVAIPSYIYDSNIVNGGIFYKREVLKSLGVTEDDIINNIILRANNLDLVEKLKEILFEIKNYQQKVVGLPANWKWFDRKKGQYQFGSVTFTQTGKIRKPVFMALMDIYEKTPQAISVLTIKEKTGVKPERIRTEIGAINGRLIKKIGFYFKGSGEGYYTLEKFAPHKK